MRIKTSEKYAWRTDLYDDVRDLLGENTRSGAVDGACEFTKEMLPALERAVEHPDMTEELADMLSTMVATWERRGLDPPDQLASMLGGERPESRTEASTKRPR